MAAKDKGAEDFNPKHRILGAIILVAVAVVIVPLLLRQHEPPTELKGNEAASLPDSPNKVIVTPVTPQVSATHRTSEAPSPVTEPAPVEPSTKALPPKVEMPAAKVEAPAKVAAPEKPAREKPAEKAAPAKTDKGWVVQVGTFSNTDNANRLSTKLKQHGHTVLTEKITLEGRSAIRLRVGPFADKSAALKAQARIERELALKGVVLTYP